jgi:hypothetical protein
LNLLGLGKVKKTPKHLATVLSTLKHKTQFKQDAFNSMTLVVNKSHAKQKETPNVKTTTNLVVTLFN